MRADRSHQRAIESPREVRNALIYVLTNFRKHERRASPTSLDPYSSATWFDGWQSRDATTGMPPPFAPAALWPNESLQSHADTFRARSWLARVGWKKLGLLSHTARPAE